MLDDDSNFVYINRDAELFFHKTSAEILGKNVWEVFSASKQSNYYHQIKEAIDDKKAACFEYISVISKSWIKLTVKPLHDGVLVTFACIETDKQNENLYKTLVENTPDIVTKWDENLCLSYGNAAFVNKTGLPLNAAIGKNHDEIWPQTNLKPLVEKTKKVIANGKVQTISLTFNTNHGELFYDIKLTPEFTLNGKVKNVIAIGRDITSIRNSQEVFNNQLRNKYISLFNSINQGFCIIEMIWDNKGKAIDYLVMEANPAFRKQTGLTDYEGKTMLEILPSHETHWFERYGEVAKTKKSAHFELPAKLINGWYEVEAFAINELGENMVGVLFNDITERKKAEEILRKSEEKHAFLLRLTDAIRFISDPIEIQQAAARVVGEYLGADNAFYGDIVNVNNTAYIQIERVYRKEDRNYFKPSLYPFSDFGECLKEIRNGKTNVVADMAADERCRTKELPLHKALGYSAWVAVPLIKNGKHVAIFMVQYQQPHAWSDEQITFIEETAERTWSYVEQAKMAKALNHSQEQLSVALTASNMSTFHWLAKGNDVVVSPLSPTVFGLASASTSYKESAGFSMIHPEDAERHKTVLLEACRYEREFHHVYRIIRPIDERIAWIEERGKGTFHPHSKISEIHGIHWDITAQKNSEDRLRQAEERYRIKLERDVDLRTRELKESRDELAAIYNNTLMGITVLDAVKDENGEIIDFRISLANRAVERESGNEDLIGKLYLEQYPGVKKVGMFDVMVKVMQNGVPASEEYFYPYEDLNKWYSCMFVKMGESLLCTSLDISERKIAEQLFNENSAMIQGIANSAPDMLYAINLDTFQQFYSNYRIEQLVEKSQAEIKRMGKAFFEEFVHPEDKSNFYTSLNELRENKRKEIKSLTYRLIDAKGKTHWISTKSTVYMRNDRGISTHIVGISQDITKERELEDRNKELTIERRQLEKKQQKEILKATLNAQEEERERIAESLHNGLGQVLYGVKATLERLKLEDQTELDNNQHILSRSKELLGMCIQESRRISHELMPSILEDFGLKVGIKDICNQLKGKTHFNCTFSKIDVQLDKYLQLAIYRIIQELTLNIVKHAEASIAQVDLSFDSEQVYIMVKDNGKGFAATDKKDKGIGLKTIESKVKLLNGKIEITSTPQQTIVYIQFPL
jgi:PAS domain S-box-containing protein